MSLSLSMSAALSGLQAQSRAAGLISSNVANALTEGYGRRELSLSVRSLGGTGQGVDVTGVRRITDAVLIGDRRAAEASKASAEALAAFFSTVEAAVGSPGDDPSLSTRVNRLDSAILAATARPESEAVLAEVLDAAVALSDHLADASATVRQERERADRQIAVSVDRLNGSLQQIADLNAQILRQYSSGQDPSGLIDNRQQLIDDLSEILPLREVEGENGQVGLFSLGGAVLLQGRPATFGFTAAGVITADMTMASGALSGLTLNGKPIDVMAETGPIAGGSLAAAFAIRDQWAPEAQDRLDGVARDLIDRFAAADTTLASGAPGLFTDAGGSYDPADQVGLAGRIEGNAWADPEQGGALWRLRDGLGAVAEGAPGNAAGLSSLHDALTTLQEPASDAFSAGERDFSSLVGDLASLSASARLGAETELSYQSGKLESLRTEELAMGVDSDQETQRLLLVEQAFAANAQVLKTVDELIRLLMEI